jgi:uncharacterized membrane protein
MLGLKLSAQVVLLTLLAAGTCSNTMAFQNPSQHIIVKSQRFQHGSENAVPRYTPALNHQSHRATCRAFQQNSSHRYRSNLHVLKALPSIALPLISPTDTLGNIACLTATASISHRLGKTTSLGKLLGPPVTAMAIAFVLGSVGVLPSGGSSGAKMLQLVSIQLATPMLLLGVNIRECRQRCGPLLKSFILAAFSTIVASLCAFPLCSKSLTHALGGDGVKIAAALMAKNVGGGLNYVAVCRSLGASPNAVAAGLCVDNIFALIYFPLTSALAAGKPDISSHDDDEVKVDNNDGDGDDFGDKKSKDANSGIEFQNGINAESVSAALTVATLATWMGETIGGQSGGLPLATCLTILFTIVCPKIAASLSSSGEALGTSLLYLFFATAGAPGLAIADSVKAAFLPLGLFLSLLYGVHGSILMLARKLMLWKRQRFDHINAESDNSALLPQRLLVASSAAIGGPATAAALAKANKWDSLVAPSLIVGNLGYAIATFCGLAFNAFYK